jgi:peptidoglycan/LPS O-acetylase OafA/YrhL
MNLIRNAFAASAVLLAVVSFVFTNVSINITTSETPLPAAVWLFAGGLGLLGMLYQKKEKLKSAWAVRSSGVS